MRVVTIAPSILAADFGRLADEVASVGDEAEWVHVDLMDGHFVPNLSIGPPVVASLRRHTHKLLDCHLMVTDPAMWLDPLAEAGADGCSVHVELGDPSPLLARTRELGMMAGVVIENRRGTDAMKRSWNLAKENFWHVLGVIIVAAIITGIVGSILRSLGGDNWFGAWIFSAIAQILTAPFSAPRTTCRWRRQCRSGTPAPAQE